MNQLSQVFNYEGSRVRMAVTNGKPWFVAKDVCEILDLTWSGAKTLERIKENHKGVVNFTTPGGVQPLLCVDEPGLYKLIARSNKEEAERFSDWVYEEVLPTVNKHGAYMTPETIEQTLNDPDFIIRLATNLKEERAQRMLAEAKLEENKPKVLFATAVETSQDSILVAELAKMLKQNGFDIGQNRLFELLRNQGYLGKSGEYYNQPTQRAMDLGLFEIKKRTITNPDGSIRTTCTTKVTGKGQIYFVNRFLKHSA